MARLFSLKLHTKKPNMQAVTQIAEMSKDQLAQHLLKYSKYIMMHPSKVSDMEGSNSIEQAYGDEMHQYQVNLVKWAENILKQDRRFGHDVIRNALTDPRETTFSQQTLYLVELMRIITPKLYDMTYDELVAKYKDKHITSEATKVQKFGDATQKLVQKIQTTDFSKLSEEQLLKISEILNENVK